MKRKKITKLIVAAICLVAFSASAAFASNVARTITVYYQDIKMYVDGQRVNTSSEPFIYNGSTYLPVRAISEALGEEVYWDGNTKSVYIGERPGTTQYLMDVCPPYRLENKAECYYPTDGDSFFMAGKKFSNGVVANNGYVLSGAYFNLNSQYSTLQCVIGPDDSAYFYDESGTVNFIADGSIIASYDIYDTSMPENITLNINGVNQLIIQFTGSGAAGVGDIKVS